MDEEVEDFLAHYGVKGMKWGVRRKSSGPEGVPRKTNRDAKKDANEFARAKMFYGESAGTRRKLIKAKVEGRTKRDPAYKKAFDHHLANQDMAKQASKAQSERKRRNVKNSTTKTARGIGHIARGNSQYASLAAVGVFGAFGAARAAGIDRKVAAAGKKTYRTAKAAYDVRQQPTVSDFLRKQGLA